MKRILSVAFALLLISNSLVAAVVVTIEGAVGKPGAVEFKQGMRLRHALQSAGGLLPNADPKTVEVVTSSGERRTVDLTELGPGPAIAPGDTVVVPVLDARNYVTVRGAVGKPGVVRFSDDLTITKAVAASSPYRDARLDNVRVTRSCANGPPETLRVDLAGVYAGVVADVALQPGDVVEVAYPAAAMSDREIVTIVVIGLLLIILLR